MHYLETTRVHYAGRSYRISAYKASFSMRKVSTRLFLRNFLKRMKVFDSLISTPPRPRLFPFGEGFVWFERIASSPFTQPFCSVSGRLASPSLFSSSQKSRFLQTLRLHLYRLLITTQATQQLLQTSAASTTAPLLAFKFRLSDQCHRISTSSSTSKMSRRP